MIEMTIDSIRVSLMNYQRVVILKEKMAGRYLPIWIGPAEADAIAIKLQGGVVPRPLTHDLLRTVIDTHGVPIYVDETVLDKAGILLDQETGKPLLRETGEAGKGKKLSEEEMRSMSAFSDFLNTLDLGDFDKRKA